MIIVITGTCAVGKSTIAQLLEKHISGNVLQIHVDRERFKNNSSHSHKWARKAHERCFEKALLLEKKGNTIVLQGNYIFSDLKDIYGTKAKYIHLNANLFKILSRHFHRKKKHPLSMILSSWFANYFLFRKTLNTSWLTTEQTVQEIMRLVYK
ncbi:MAG: AAA family ATPase [Nanoarchaeota archaeon]|nr:AAA family ATPase [Nanoarchaeota archaeon]